jgi:hypothetical protein
MEGGDLSFYEAVAQIIPVIFITLVVEQTFLGTRRDEKVRAFEQVGLMISFVAILSIFVSAEAVTLHVLSRGSATADEHDLVSFAVAVCAAFLLVPVTVRFARGLSRTAGEIVAWVIALGAMASVVMLYVIR